MALTIAVPSLYLRDWPDVYIHTNHDNLDQIDATKLRRVALLGAAAGYVYAGLDAKQLPILLSFLTAQSETRMAQSFLAAQNLVSDPELKGEIAWYEAQNLLNQALNREVETLHSVVNFTGGPSELAADSEKALANQTASFRSVIEARAKVRGVTHPSPKAPWNGSDEAKRIPVRVGEFGPLTYQNDNVLLARLGKERYVKIKLINSESTQLLNVRDQSELYAYEIVNFINGKRTVGEIRDAVSAEYGPLPLSLVADYLDACVAANVIQWK